MAVNERLFERGLSQNGHEAGSQTLGIPNHLQGSDRIGLVAITVIVSTEVISLEDWLKSHGGSPSNASFLGENPERLEAYIEGLNGINHSRGGNVDLSSEPALKIFANNIGRTVRDANLARQITELQTSMLQR